MLFDDDFQTFIAGTENDEIYVWKGIFKTDPATDIINQFTEEDKFSFDGP